MSVIILPEPTGSIYPPAGAASQPPPQARTWTASLRRLGRSLGNVVFEAMMEYRLRRAARELRMLDDHMLRDIGISRTEIDRIVRYGRENETRPLRDAFRLSELRRD